MMLLNKTVFFVFFFKKEVQQHRIPKGMVIFFLFFLETMAHNPLWSLANIERERKKRKSH